MSRQKTTQNVKISTTIHSEIRIVAAKSGKKIYEIVEDALNQYLNDEGKSQDKKPEGIGVII